MYVPTKYEMPKMQKAKAKRKIKMQDVFEMTPVGGKGVIAPPSSSRRERSPRRLPPQTQQPRTPQPYAQKS